MMIPTHMATDIFKAVTINVPDLTLDVYTISDPDMRPDGWPSYIVGLSITNPGMYYIIDRFDDTDRIGVAGPYALQDLNSMTVDDLESDILPTVNNIIFRRRRVFDIEVTPALLDYLRTL